MKRYSIVCFILLGGMSALSMAEASRPVAVTITGCVVYGLILSEQTDFGSHVQQGRYQIRPVLAGMQPADMSLFEGKRIAIQGNLLPGDLFIIDQRSVGVLGPCDPPSTLQLDR